MSSVTLEYCSLHYLDQWLRKEKELCGKISADALEERLKAVSAAATFFKVARNLPKKFEGKNRRYKKVLDILDGIDVQGINQATIIDVVKKTSQKLSKFYGGREVLSFTSKLMWVKVKSPVIIYDKQARESLGATSDYEDYCKKWRETYKRSEAKVEASCAKLSKVKKYCFDPIVGTDTYISALARKKWFKHRVFDIYLWHSGDARS